MYLRAFPFIETLLKNLTLALPFIRPIVVPDIIIPVSVVPFLDSVLNLVCLKESEPERYYNVVHYENILINILASIMGLKYRIVLNPEDLLHPYYLTLSRKS